MLITTLPHIATAFILLASLIGLYHFKNADKPWRIFIAFMAYSFIHEIISLVLGRSGQNNLWLINIFILAQNYFLIIGGILLYNNKFRRMLAAIALLLSTLLWGYQLYDVGIFTLFQLSMLISCLMFLVLYLSLLFRFITNHKLPLLRNPVFWFCIAIIAFYGCSIPIFSSFIYLNLIKKEKNYPALYTIINILSIIESALIAYSFYLLKKRNTYNA